MTLQALTLFSKEVHAEAQRAQRKKERGSLFSYATPSVVRK